MPNYPNAPIQEAVIDFRVTLPESFDVEDFNDLEEMRGKPYPKVEEVHSWGGMIHVGKAGFQATDFEEGLKGYMYKSEDQRSLAQFRIDGFTFNRLEPYTSWESVFSEALDLWALYVDTSNPSAVNRLALRYINRFQLPTSLMTEVEKYLKTAPRVPEGVDIEAVDSLGISAHAFDKASEVHTILRTSIDREEGSRQLQVVLDTDVFVSGSFSTDPDELKQYFGELRERKNQIFQGSITEAAGRLFE